MSKLQQAKSETFFLRHVAVTH